MFANDLCWSLLCQTWWWDETNQHQNILQVHALGIIYKQETNKILASWGQHYRHHGTEYSIVLTHDHLMINLFDGIRHKCSIYINILHSLRGQAPVSITPILLCARSHYAALAILGREVYLNSGGGSLNSLVTTSLMTHWLSWLERIQARVGSQPEKSFSRTSSSQWSYCVPIMQSRDIDCEKESILFGSHNSQAQAFNFVSIG